MHPLSTDRLAALVPQNQRSSAPAVNRRMGAALALSAYLSTLLRCKIEIPAHLGGGGDRDEFAKTTIYQFINTLPKVVQQAVDGPSLTFQLPLVAHSKGTTLAPEVADVVNDALLNHSEAEIKDDTLKDCCLEVPTFFYNDASVMLVRFNSFDLGTAISIIEQNPAVADFVRASTSRP